MCLEMRFSVLLIFFFPGLRRVMIGIDGTYYGTKEMVDMDNLVKQVVEGDINAYQNNLIYIDGLQGPVRHILGL